MNGFRILLAEDEAAVAASVGEQLRALGHEVVAEATTGREAVSLATRTKPDLLIMDIKMPGGDGIEAAREIAERCPIPIVFLSGHFDEDLLAGVTASGGLAYLLKPASSDQLQAALALASTRFDEMESLREQAARLQEMLEARKLISRAKGLLMQRHGLTHEDARRHMQKEAVRSSMRLVDFARAILAGDVLQREPGAGSDCTL